jgi:hypothetical protein
VGGTLLLLVGGTGAWLAVSGTPPAQLLELVGRGGDTKLSEPMRPARGGPRAIVLAFDGVGADELRQALAAGSMPSLSAVLGRPSVDEATVRLSVWDGGRLVPLHRWLARHPRPDLLDLERRLEGLVLGPYGDHAGDILLLARTGSERPIEERFYFSHEYRSWHGSPTRQDSEIPLVVARAGRSGAEIRQLVHRLAGERPDQLDIAPLVRGLLTPDAPLGLR